MKGYALAHKLRTEADDTPRADKATLMRSAATEIEKLIEETKSLGQEQENLLSLLVDIYKVATGEKALCVTGENDSGGDTEALDYISKAIAAASITSVAISGRIPV